MSCTVISFYTPDWKYPEYANLLKEDCSRLGIKFSIDQLPSQGEYVKNCNIKPKFIRDKIHQLKSPVLWIDVDGSLLKLPELLLSHTIGNYDIAGCHPVNNTERIHVGSIWFNYTDTTLDFLDAWAAAVDNSIDDAAFNGIWQRFKDRLQLFLLPPEYFFIHKRVGDNVPEDTVILHRLSSSELKMQYKRKVEKR
jgi:hypothetical protein